MSNQGATECPAAAFGRPVRDQDILAVIEHASRRIRIPGGTAHPTAGWVAQTAHNLVMDVEDDRTLIFDQRHLLHALREYEVIYNEHRPHQGIANARPQAPRYPNRSPTRTGSPA